MVSFVVVWITFSSWCDALNYWLAMRIRSSVKRIVTLKIQFTEVILHDDIPSIKRMYIK